MKARVRVYKRCLKGQGDVKTCEERNAHFGNTRFLRECGGIQNREKTSEQLSNYQNQWL